MTGDWPLSPGRRQYETGGGAWQVLDTVSCEGSEGSEGSLTCADLAVLADNVRGGQ